uniref:guanylate cyclase n=1 Tax=Haemonchus contortus TaxID=6289 RepID=W6ND81_HAECO
METKVKMRDFLRTRQLATINQTYVLVETIALKERLVFFKQDIDLLLKIKHSSHENVNPFIGISYDSTRLYVLWTHCFRGSLAEQIFGRKDERATFDNNFRGAFVRDILKGLDYIHNSSIGYHGSLTTGHCLIDSHWILKVSGFGVSRMLFRMKNSGVIGTEDGRPFIPNGGYQLPGTGLIGFDEIIANH